MLSAEEVFELTLAFKPVGTPLLVREIIAELKKDPAQSSRLPVEVLQELARKMSQAHGVQPTDFRKLTIGNLCGVDVPMIGQVPVDVAGSITNTLWKQYMRPPEETWAAFVSQDHRRSGTRYS